MFDVGSPQPLFGDSRRFVVLCSGFAGREPGTLLC